MRILFPKIIYFGYHAIRTSKSSFPSRVAESFVPQDSISCVLYYTKYERLYLHCVMTFPQQTTAHILRERGY